MSSREDTNLEVCQKVDGTPDEKTTLKLETLEKALGYVFENKGLLRTALIHSSYAHEQNMRCDNERLELLGDAVLHLVLTEHLLEQYPNDDEGELSALRSYCESEPFLSDLASDLNIGEFIAFGKGERQGGGKNKQSLLSNTLEAVIAAIHLDSNYKKVRSVLLLLFKERVRAAREDGSYIDAKSELQKLSQKHYGALPKYLQTGESGEEHKKVFTVRAVVDRYSADGKGSTKKNAEKDAAKRLFAVLKNIDHSQKKVQS